MENNVTIAQVLFQINSLKSSAHNCSDQPKNPYCGKFGVEEIVDVLFLSIFTLVGTLGNLLVIFSIIYAKRVHKHGNIFIINLAICDLLVCGVFLPTGIANVIATKNVLSKTMCDIIGYLASTLCACSITNLTFIAFNRYMAVTRKWNLKKVYSKRNSYLMVAFTWLWANLLLSPTLFGWSGLAYNYEMQLCGWDKQKSKSYVVCLMVVGIFFPVSLTAFLYWKLYGHVKKRGEFLGQKTTETENPINANKLKKRLNQEIKLLKTLVVTVFLFVICWTPYGIVILFFHNSALPQVIKAVIRFALSNSVVNFVVYGVMNPVYRKGYKDFIMYLCCK